MKTLATRWTCDITGCGQKVESDTTPAGWRRFGKTDVCDAHKVRVLIDGKPLEVPASPAHRAIPDYVYGIGGPIDQDRARRGNPRRPRSASRRGRG